jgi:hypothetical protein
MIIFLTFQKIKCILIRTEALRLELIQRRMARRPSNINQAPGRSVTLPPKMLAKAENNRKIVALPFFCRIKYDNLI